ncbi:MAG: Glu-tRNA(Gln) amidotransferase subunit GatE, partial [Nitrososphaerota archaeon]|nr:Glu-tRNA(Gln) amidotransferase subunit GatE [Nitrososphaerota archaeon]
AKTAVYRWSSESSCLVEADEEPPHPLNGEALDVVLVVAKLLRSNLLDEVHVMRKIVIDGSNTTGFQRTAVVGLGGRLDVGDLQVGVQTVTLEEDAARILGEDAKSRYFALDRLGVPLVEVALEPVTGTPEQVGEVALHLGRALRSTGKVARGLGTIRQDLNVSAMGGKVVEVKGVQKLNLIPKVVAYEASRQMGLILVAAEFGKRGRASLETASKEVSPLLGHTSCRVVQKAIGEGGSVECISAPGLAGLLGWEPFPGIRLGKELAEVARAGGLGGVIHSDEFAKQGVSRDEEDSLRNELGSASDAGLVLVAGEPERVRAAVAMLRKRLEEAPQGVPAETRTPTDEGETRYMRPRPGAQRMYPETDIPDIVITKQRVKDAEESVPERWQARVKRLEKDFSLSGEMALKVYDSDRAALFERLARRAGVEGSFVATVVVDLPTRLAREGVPEEAVTDGLLEDVLKAIAEGKVAKEVAPDIVRLVAKGEAADVGSAVESLGLRPMGRQELEELVDELLRHEEKLVEERGEGAFSALMGEVMEKARGRADGHLASTVLRDRLKSRLES